MLWGKLQKGLEWGLDSPSTLMSQCHSIITVRERRDLFFRKKIHKYYRLKSFSRRDALALSFTALILQYDLFKSNVPLISSVNWEARRNMKVNGLWVFTKHTAFQTNSLWFHQHKKKAKEKKTTGPVKSSGLLCPLSCASFSASVSNGHCTVIHCAVIHCAPSGLCHFKRGLSTAPEGVLGPRLIQLHFSAPWEQHIAWQVQ